MVNLTLRKWSGLRAIPSVYISQVGLSLTKIGILDAGSIMKKYKFFEKGVKLSRLLVDINKSTIWMERRWIIIFSSKFYQQNLYMILSTQI